MSKFSKDFEFGILKENDILPIIRKNLNDPTITKLDNYNIFDFRGNNKYIELKSRNCNYNKYPSTMIGYNKIFKASLLNEDIYFYFCFEDGLYYWKYDNNIKLETKQSGRRDRGKPELNEYCYIPIEILKKVY